MASQKDNNNVKDYDIFKDSLLRYLGYANEVGESFRVLVPVSVVRLSYAVATAYVVADSIDKGYLKWKKPFVDEKTKYRQVGIATADTLIWQGLASVAIPGFTINRICWATRHALASMKFLPHPVKIWGVVAAGLGSIPFIVHPIDRGTDWLLDNTVRKYYGSS
ncbi:unnamed protein product [Candidula unifasciata]|uniref:Mitochondrial fission process protein 1 n=1 Tax=Candidula unifasciata TaxID=100452 RepID=A0A8S3ZG42_9EUPU|nr:unnamed protein product [Candidula unifasciata]